MAASAGARLERARLISEDTRKRSLWSWKKGKFATIGEEAVPNGSTDGGKSSDNIDGGQGNGEHEDEKADEGSNAGGEDSSQVSRECGSSAHESESSHHNATIQGDKSTNTADDDADDSPKAPHVFTSTNAFESFHSMTSDEELQAKQKVLLAFSIIMNDGNVKKAQAAMHTLDLMHKFKNFLSQVTAEEGLDLLYPTVAPETDEGPVRLQKMLALILRIREKREQRSYVMQSRKSPGFAGTNQQTSSDASQRVSDLQESATCRASSPGGTGAGSNSTGTIRKTSSTSTNSSVNTKNAWMLITADEDWKTRPMETSKWQSLYPIFIFCISCSGDAKILNAATVHPGNLMKFQRLMENTTIEQYEKLMQVRSEDRSNGVNSTKAMLKHMSVAAPSMLTTYTYIQGTGPTLQFQRLFLFFASLVAKSTDEEVLNSAVQDEQMQMIFAKFTKEISVKDYFSYVNDAEKYFSDKYFCSKKFYKHSTEEFCSDPENAMGAFTVRANKYISNLNESWDDSKWNRGKSIASAVTAEFVPNAEALSALLPMGFSENCCKRALKATGNKSAEAAMEWVFAHMQDADINDPLPIETAAAGGGGSRAEPQFDEMAITTLQSMGFPEKQAKKALKACDGDAERAADWLLSRPAEELDAEEG